MKAPAPIRLGADLLDRLNPPGLTWTARLAGVGDGRTLGEVAARLAARQIARRVRIDQLGSDDEPLDALSKRYQIRKERQGFDERILVRTGEMTAAEQILGDQVEIAEHQVTLHPGIDQAVMDRMTATDDVRPWLRLSAGDLEIIRATLQRQIDHAMARFGAIDVTF